MKISNYVLDIGKILSGMMLVNILSMATLPIITRMYNPGVYGGFQSLLALILTLSAFSTLKYEMAVVLPKHNTSAVSVVKLAFYILLSFTAIYLVVDLFFHGDLAGYLKVPMYSAWLLPILVFLTACKPIYLSWYSRNRRYGKISRNNVAEQLINRPLMILFGWISPSAISLVMAYGFSKIFTTVNLMRHSRINLMKMKKKLLGFYLVKYKKFPLFLTPATFANTLSAQAPMLLLGYFFSPAVVAYYAVVQRLINMPMALVQQSMSQVYYERAAKELQSKGNAAAITLKTIATLTVLSCVGGTFLFFFGSPILKIFLGAKFAQSGSYLILLIPWFLFRFIKAPINYWVLINRQEMTLGLHFLQLLCTAASFWFFHDTPKHAILAFSMFMGGYYLINTLLIVIHCFKAMMTNEG